jgi:glycine oxidase
MPKVDFLIVGQGLAGSLLAAALLGREASILAVDQPSPHSPSRVAAGLVTPITGARLKPSWRFPLFQPFARDRYAQLADQLDLPGPLWNDRPMVRILRDAREQAAWAKARPLALANHLLNLKTDPVPTPPGLPTDQPRFAMAGGAYVDIPALLAAVRGLLVSRSSLVEATLLTHELVPSPGHIAWRDVQARHVIFCSGSLAAPDQLAHLALRDRRHGDILELEPSCYGDPTIFHGGAWLVRQCSGRVLAGASYRPCPPPPPLPDPHREAAVAELARRAAWLLGAPPPIIAIRSAPRPTLRDRQAVVGTLPWGGLWQGRASTFNGLGSHGALRAPLLADALAHALLDRRPIDPTLVP